MAPVGLAEFQVPRQKIGMQVREHDVLDAQAVFVRKLQVARDIALRVHHDRTVRRLVGDQIGCVGEAVQIELLEDHARPLFHG